MLTGCHMAELLAANASENSGFALHKSSSEGRPKDRDR